MKIAEIKPKHLVLGQEYDDFAKATDKVDFSKEDLCCQVVGLTAVYYWINTESVWGPMGFIWDEYNHHGHFTTSTLSFSIIPKIPDSHRHLSLEGIFKNISKVLTFLDSGWSHINEFKQFRNNTTLIDWYCNSISDLENTINIGTVSNNEYKLHASLPNTIVDKPIKLILLPENKNKLKLHLIGTNSNVDCSEIEDIETLDLSNYLLFDRLAILSGILSVNNISQFDKIIYDCCEKSNNYNGGLRLGFNTGSTKIVEKVTYILRDDLIDEPINITNNNNVPSKEFEYININSSKFTHINNYFVKGYFQYDTPQITQQMLDFTTGSIFSYCYFYKKYKYGSVKPISKIFSNCKAYYKSEDIIIGAYYAELSLTGIKVEHFNNAWIIDTTSIFDYNYTKEDAENNIEPVIPTYAGNSGVPNVSIYDLKVPYVINKYGTSTGTIEYKNYTINYLYVLDKENAVIINNDCTFDQQFSSEYCIVYFQSDILRSNQIIFRTNRENIKDYKKVFNTSFLWKLYHMQDIEIPYIIRTTNIVVNPNANGNYKHNYLLLPDVTTDVILYNVNINITQKSDKNPTNTVVQHMLDNIVTVGNVSDSSGKQIKLLTEYYQAMKESTKTRLISDGYTIVEVI